MTAELDQTLLALADPTRRAVVDLLSAGPQRSGALAEALSLSPPAMSRHLRVLRKARLVEEQALEDDARVRVYRLRAEPLQALRGWVDEVSAFWGDQLQAFKAFAEGKGVAGGGARAVAKAAGGGVRASAATKAKKAGRRRR
jgi:DNA-binding transcriptional ArsR family regulator